LVLFFELIYYRFELLNLFLKFLRIQHIAFVAQQDFGNFVSTMEDQLLEPHFGIVQSILLSDIEYDACCFGKVEVIVDDGSESLLSG
jgi:hypothetical protein